jgi:hypothetical protein
MPAYAGITGEGEGVSESIFYHYVPAALANGYKVLQSRSSLLMVNCATPSDN